MPVISERSEPENIMSENHVIEKTAVIAYSLLQQMHEILADPRAPDQVTLGILLGTAMFCDEKVGPFRAERLMRQAPGIVLKSDAHVNDETLKSFIPVLRAFGEHLQVAMAPGAGQPAPPMMTLA
jgi:hypothetical protein